MRILRNTGCYLLLLLLTTGIQATAQSAKGTGKWKAEQLISPEILAARIQSGEAANMLILNTGPVEDIPGAVHIGEVEKSANVKKLARFLDDQPRDKEIVIYCGCCPLSGCPNIEPAYKKLAQMKFTNFKILNMPQDLQEDWIDKGYPMPAKK
ncbi:rhodanese-like domain-containing protein [Taibaiella chishuiensis]|uniref:Rhodanese domain-containing protein n=1 Tax=Taibaiella chishuiensis TaxID=1434707 RepID=A0A2P8DB80_9BACT|nr:rhodanese-like domain-containing protein [Taibaiella chishuiensis]PSK94483.1 hypothetical protein B0I18_101639 [Taibaiella chishuiensis]